MVPLRRFRRSTAPARLATGPKVWHHTLDSSWPSLAMRLNHHNQGGFNSAWKCVKTGKRARFRCVIGVCGRVRCSSDQAPSGDAFRESPRLHCIRLGPRRRFNEGCRRFNERLGPRSLNSAVPPGRTFRSLDIMPATHSAWNSVRNGTCARSLRPAACHAPLPAPGRPGGVHARSRSSGDSMRCGQTLDSNVLSGLSLKACRSHLL